MDDGESSTKVKGQAGTELDEIYYERFREDLKGGRSVIRDSLVQILTLDAAALGGDIAFLNGNKVDAAWRLWSMLFFLASLLAVLFGIFPFRSTIDPINLTAIRSSMDKWDSIRYWTAVVALGLFLIGVILATVAVQIGPNRAPAAPKYL